MIYYNAEGITIESLEGQQVVVRGIKQLNNDQIELIVRTQYGDRCAYLNLSDIKELIIVLEFFKSIIEAK